MNLDTVEIFLDFDTDHFTQAADAGACSTAACASTMLAPPAGADQRVTTVTPVQTLTRTSPEGPDGSAPGPTTCKQSCWT
jgi:hypothetical protein